MPNYVRPKKTGATLFITVNLADRRSSLLIDKVSLLRDAFTRTIADRNFIIDAIAILPNRFHMVMTLPHGDHDYPTRIRIIKARFSRQVDRGYVRASHQARRERGIWQRRYWEHHIRDQKDYDTHVGFCWKSPVLAGLVKSPLDWEFSSAHRDKQMLEMMR